MSEKISLDSSGLSGKNLVFAFPLKARELSIACC